jgi:hypothetical protein
VAVEGVEAGEAGERVALAVVDVEAELAQPARSLVEVGHHEGRVGLPRRRVRLLDADVQLGGDGAGVGVRPEPAAAARRELGGLLDLGHAQSVGVEAASRVLAPGRTGDLHVVQPHDSALWATTKIRRNGRMTRPAVSAG